MELWEWEGIVPDVDLYGAVYNQTCQGVRGRTIAYVTDCVRSDVATVFSVVDPGSVGVDDCTLRFSEGRVEDQNMSPLTITVSCNAGRKVFFRGIFLAKGPFILKWLVGRILWRLRSLDYFTPEALRTFEVRLHVGDKRYGCRVDTNTGDVESAWPSGHMSAGEPVLLVPVP